MIKIVRLQLKTTQPEKALKFYIKILQMQLVRTVENDDEAHYILAFKGDTMQLALVYNKKETLLYDYREERYDNYWKYSLFINDIQSMYELLVQEGVPVSTPYQFGNIGYLSHTQDEEHYQIEFIQKSFKDNELPAHLSAAASENIPTFGLITLRTKDPVKSIQFYETFFDLKLFVRMYVDKGNGFTLYFLGNKDLKPPVNDIDALENREWMYQQKATFIELQHYWGSEYQKDFEFQTKETLPMGLDSIHFKAQSIQDFETEIKEIPYQKHYNNLGQQVEIHMLSPDRHKLIIS